MTIELIRRKDDLQEAMRYSKDLLKKNYTGDKKKLRKRILIMKGKLKDCKNKLRILKVHNR